MNEWNECWLDCSASLSSKQGKVGKFLPCVSAVRTTHLKLLLLYCVTLCCITFSTKVKPEGSIHLKPTSCSWGTAIVGFLVHSLASSGYILKMSGHIPLWFIRHACLLTQGHTCGCNCWCIYACVRRHQIVQCGTKKNSLSGVRSDTFALHCLEWGWVFFCRVLGMSRMYLPAF